MDHAPGAMLALIFKMSTALLWFTLALMLTSGWGLRTNLTGKKKRDFGVDDLTTPPCSVCLV